MILNNSCKSDTIIHFMKSTLYVRFITYNWFHVKIKRRTNYLISTLWKVDLYSFGNHLGVRGISFSRMRPHTSAKSDHERKETFGYSNIFTSLSLFKARCMSEREILQLDKASQKLYQNIRTDFYLFSHYQMYKKKHYDVEKSLHKRRPSGLKWYSV